MDVGRSPSVAAAPTPSQAVDPIPDSEKLKRKRQPRNSACQGCAALKMKCIAGPNGKCERCDRMGRDCIPAVPKPRKRRAQSASDLPSPKAIPLSNILSSDASSSIPSTSHYTRISSRPPDQRTEAVQEQHHVRQDPALPENQSFESLFLQGLHSPASLPLPNGDFLRGIDYQYVVNAFALFRKFTHYFPFVEISPGADVISMVTQRPILTLAVCTVTSSSRPDLQNRLSQAFCFAIASKMLLAGERSMDLLTGLLVYIAWHHHYMSQQKIYRQMCLLAGMVADLGLYSSKPELLDPSSALERDRAFVGSYYLCSGLSASGFDKPSPLRWTDNLRRCAENAALSGHLPSDRTLISIVELMHAVDDLEDYLQLDNHYSHTAAPHFITLHTRVAGQRINALKREYPSLKSSLGFAAANIQVNQRNLRPHDPLEYHVLIQCACAIKEYIDDLLLRPPATLHLISIVDWTSFLGILLLMAQMPRYYPLPASGSSWDTGAANTYLHPETILDSIYAHMASLPHNDPLSPRNEALLRWFRNFCDGVKTRTLASERHGSAGAGHYGPNPKPGDSANPPSTSSAGATSSFRPEASIYDTHSKHSGRISTIPPPLPPHSNSSLPPAASIVDGRFRPLSDARPLLSGSVRLPPPTATIDLRSSSSLLLGGLDGRGILEEGFLSGLLSG